MKKYTSGSFVDAAVRVYGSEADTITSFPATIIADGENASAVIYGNMQQSGTPTPASPIYPSECGELVSSNYTVSVISGGVTTSINLAEVQTTRMIKKLVLTGEENYAENLNWKKENTSVYYTSAPNMYSSYTAVFIASTHFEAVGRNILQNSDNNCISLGGNAAVFRIDTSIASDNTEFKLWVAQQYTAGTPLTVWYVLATEETGIINEPIREIEDYADSVAAAAIPTTAGSQTFNVDTTLKPSSVSLTYTGWHTHADKQYSGGQWGQVTSNAKVLRRKRTTKKKT